MQTASRKAITGINSYQTETYGYEGTTGFKTVGFRSNAPAGPYSVISSNCEHFVRWATGLNVSSSQVIAGTSGVAAGLLLVALFAKNPKLLQYLGGAVAIGALAVLSSRAMIKSEP